jgi:hypothetical protein
MRPEAEPEADEADARHWNGVPFCDLDVRHWLLVEPARDDEAEA